VLSLGYPLEEAMTDQNQQGKIQKSEAEWRAQLTPEQYQVARRHGTEQAFTGPYWDEKKPGVYSCICCGTPLFLSDTKYDSGSGWPSFYAPVSGEVIEEHQDNSHFMQRIEIRCAKCEAHLGHVFPDGPKPTGLRYCTNGTALKFDPAKG
jgi:peptide-methionine (R)-S-oxide reductase